MQAESDHHVRDTYNYVTVQTDIAMPKRLLVVLQDTVRQDAWAAAIADAVAAIKAEDKDCRVLDLGAGAGNTHAAWPSQFASITQHLHLHAVVGSGCCWECLTLPVSWCSHMHSLCQTCVSVRMEEVKQLQTCLINNAYVCCSCPMQTCSCQRAGAWPVCDFDVLQGCMQ